MKQPKQATPQGEQEATTSGEQGVTPSHPEKAAPQEGQDQEMAEVAPEGTVTTPVGKTSGQPAGGTEDSTALPADVAVLLHLPGMVETLQHMVADAAAKVQAREAAKVVDLEQSRAAA